VGILIRIAPTSSGIPQQQNNSKIGSTSLIPIFKFFTRDREVSEEIFELINTQAEENGYSSLIYWEKQSVEECREPSGQPALAALVGLILLCGLSTWASNYN